jgi:hypothetical protein
MHGVSGTGKTTVSTEIIKSIAAIRIRSDVERKRLFGNSLQSKKKVPLGDGLYHSDIITRTYDQLRELTRTLLKAGLSVVVDATFLQHHQRELFIMLAKEQACPWLIVDVFAPEAVLEDRIERRSRKGDDASDATVDVMKRQRESEEPFAGEEQSNVIRVDSTDQEGILSVVREIKKWAILK